MLTLEDIRVRLGWNPWHWWGFVHPTLAPLNGKCDDTVYEFSYQDGDSCGRADIVDKIIYCHDTVAGFLGYDVGLRYNVEEFQWPNYVTKAIRPLRQAQADGRWMSLPLKKGEIESIGYLRRDLIESPAVTFQDPNSDGLNEVFIISLPAPDGLADASQVVVYFQEGDLPTTTDDRFSIRYKIAPVKVTIADGYINITGYAWMLGKPSVYEWQQRGRALDPTNDSNFAQAVDVFREWIDPDGTTTSTAQVTLTWETVPAEMSGFCCGSSSDPASTNSVVARAGIRNAPYGIAYIGQAVYSATTEQWSSVHWSTCRPPDRGIIRYRAGVPLDATWRQVLTKFVAAELPRRLCACDTANRAIYEWQFDRARTGGNAGEQYGATPFEDLGNPLGTKTGQIQAWKYISPLLRDRSIRL